MFENLCNRRILAAEFRQRFNIHILHDSHSAITMFTIIFFVLSKRTVAEVVWLLSTC